MTQDRNHSFTKVLRKVLVVTLMLLTGSNALAQVTVNGSVFGGGNLATVGGSVTVNIKAGTVEQDVYGGGALANTNINNATNYGKENESITSTSTNTTIVNLTGGTIKGDAYGGGLGRIGVTEVTGVHWTAEEIEAANEGDPAYGKTTDDWKVEPVAGVAAVEAKVYGDINVKLGKEDGSTATAFYINRYTGEHSDVVKSGRVFGCNNLNGSPKGNVTVTVWKTVAGNTNRSESANKNNANATYEVAAVYGGGNLANYTTTGKKTHVIINGCSNTSIKYVYGGGNAAAVPETDVDINAAYEIGYVFGGGNGKDQYTLDGTTWINNPGANVNGNANTVLTGGVIHEAFGGSNERGAISGSVSINTQSGDPQSENYCALSVGKLYGAGKNADIEGDLIVILGCMPGDENPTDEVYGGAENANVKGNVELTITSGTFGKVFGGNNQSGAIFGHIKLNIEETGCTPIKIDELYLGGNMAPYSVYGYYQDGLIEGTDKPKYVARQSASDTHTAVYFGDNSENDHTKAPYADPELNIISATHIGEVFGGGYGANATLYGNPIVNINMIPGHYAAQIDRDNNGSADGVAHRLATIGDVYGGGDAANVNGNTTVNIGTATTAYLNTEPTYRRTNANTPLTPNAQGKYEQPVEGAYISGDVYGGGKLADVGKYDVENDHVDVVGNTYVYVCAVEDDDPATTTVTEYASVSIQGTGYEGVTIGGNVFGGGQGEAAESGAGAFKCAKAIVTGGTNIHIGNGTINGTVYGGGEVGRVEGNSVVAIGIGAGGTTPASAPIVLGDVFGAGKGKKTHGYSALLRGNPTVTIEGDAKVRGSVYGGGEIASVGRYNVKKGPNNPAGAPDDVLVGMPYSLANSGSGYCTVIVQGNAEIGPETEMKMKTTSGIPDDTGHVIGGGKGVLPYDGYGVTDDDWVGDPWRVSINDQKDIFNSTTYPTNYEKEYFKYIETLALATETNVTIAGNAFVKGSVYGGSLNGHVQHDTHVNIAGGQIGQGEGVTKGRYSTEDWASTSLAECPHWDYVANSGAPYDPLATASGTYDYTNYGFVQQADKKANSDGGLPVAEDGHTYYGNVFGGGSGVIPYAPGLWHRGAGSVGGDTYVNITGGHILSSVYGGNEHTDVGTYTKDASGQPTTTPAASDARGKCTVNMTGGTVGVPRTDEQKKAHPLVGNVFGAGKGDQRIFFNSWTNVINTEVNISGSARIYGSVFGGGEDGHVISDAVTNIGNVTTRTGKDANGDEITASEDANGLIIGTTGTSYSDGNVFGGGRGFSGEAQTAGTVGGNVEVNINAGSVYGSVYGGGRLASVGTMFEFPTQADGTANPAYGQFKEDDTNGTYGHVTINISGGTIGNPAATGDGAVHSGNVFGGSMGRLELLNGTRNPIWPKMAQVKETNVNIYGTAVVRRSVYGGGELGTVRDNAYVTIGGYKTAEANANGEVPVTTSAGDATNPTTVMRDVYGGGYGSEDKNYTIFTIPELKSATADPTDPTSYDSHTYAFTPMQFAGCVGMNTYVNVVGGYIRKSVYGGGEMASVGVINYRAAETTSEPAADKVKIGPIAGKTYYYENIVKHGDPATGFALSWPYKFEYVDGYPGATHIKVTGGRLGLKDSDTDTGFDDNGDVYGAGKGKAGDFKDYLFCANVGSTDVKIAYTSTPEAYTGTGDLVAGAVYGGGEDGHVMGNTKMTISGGLIYHSVYGGGSGKGTYNGSLLKIGATEGSTTESDYYTRKVYSITAGKVFGNTEVNMSGGYVVRNIYGGGNMGSVGKGNYAGGSDDYSSDGYGEKVANLWSNTDFTGSGKCKVTITGGTIGYIDTTNPSNSMYPKNSTASLPYGNVFGGCRGEAAPDLDVTPSYLYSPEFFMGYVNETEVTIEGDNTKILGSVYGGGMDGHVRRDASVTVKGGVIGVLFDTTNKGILGDNPENIQWLARGNVYGAGSGIGTYNADVITYKEGYTGTILTGTGNSTSAGSVTRFTKVDIQGGTIYRNVYGGGSLASVGAPKIDQDYFEYRKGDTTEGHGVGKQTLNEVIISGGNIGGDYSYNAGNYVYGGRVFGGSRGDATLDATKFSTSMFTSVSVNANATPANSPVITGSVFGGGEVGIVKGSVDVTLNGGTVEHDVYGGGALANTNTETTSSVPYTTTVNLLGGLIKGDAYGGGLGQKTGFNSATSDIAAVVYGDISVNLGSSAANSSATAFYVDKYTDTNHAGIVKSGRVFGCNNLMGSPQGDVRVTVYKTVKGNIERTDQDAITSNKALKESYPDTYESKDGYVAPTYHVAAVYGGGNLADYSTAGKKVYVRIETCDVSIRDVYGGGNAAEVPETDVLVRGAYEIGEVFGGGNGKDPYTNGTDWIDNPGANIGNATNPGNAKSLLTGGFVHEAYGGSNEKGTIFGSVSIDMGVGSSADHTDGICTLDVEKLVGAGKNADVNGDLIMIMGCKPSTKTPLLYAGADNANVKGNVELTITSGNFGKVFGGNNEGGAIFGHIKLNIEETGGCDTPITIDELYLGGNMAAYSVYGYYEDGTMPGSTKPLYKPIESATDNTHTALYWGDGSSNDHTKAPYAQPELNVVSCTYIGQIFGGGYGTGAALYGDPIVNINMIQGSKADGVPAFMTAKGLTASDNPNKLGIIGDVYGGGNAADVIGNTTVNIGMATTVQCHESFDKTNGYTMTGAQNVLGAYITGNVFGGGNEANVSGNTYVNICGTQESDSESENGYKDTAVGHSGTEGFAISIGNSVYGGGNAADVLGNTFVTFADGYVFNGIFGGGLAGSVGTYTRDKSVTVFGHTANHDGCIGKPTECTAGGTCYVVVSGGQIGPVEVATQGMNRTAANGGPVPQGWVWGGGCGLIEDPSVPAHQDTHFKAYVNNTDVTIKDNAFILESIIGGGEFGRVLGNTLVKIKGGQIGVGEGMVVNGKPVRYTDAQFIDPTNANTPITESNELAACSHFPFGRNTGTEAEPNWVYDTYDPYADSYKAAHSGSDKYPGGSTDNASDGKTWIGCVFAGGSGYMPVVKAKDTNNKVTNYEWISSAGWVEGNAVLRISGGHILSNVYGGNEITSVQGKCTVTMTGGTIGVPRTRAQVLANPMIGNLFGAGKGDPRSYFDTFTNVQDVEVNVSGGIIYGSVYGGSEDGHVLGNAVVNISGGAKIGTWGASYIDGNVYGGGMGATTNVMAGIIKGNTTVTIENSTVGENTVSPTILHNVYGGGAYGSVGTFTYNENKVITGHTANTGIANVTITGGTIGTNGHENGMVFGSSRGDVGAPGEIHDKLAWVYDTHVTIGTQNSETGPAIKGSLYGSGENGHTYNDAEVTIHSGTIGITDTSIDGGAAYLYRGNVYGGGCGTDMYDSNNDNVLDAFNPLAGIVYGNTTVTIDGGLVVHNVYGAGAMGSVGTFTKDNNNAITFTSGGTTTIEISGGIIGVDGSKGEGNVFGAARGNKAVTDRGLALVKETGITISGSTTTTQIKGNVYGGGEVGNVHTNATVDVQGGAIAGNVFGGGKGVEDLFSCEQAMVGVDGDGAGANLDSNENKNKGTIVTISNGTVGTLEGEGESQTLKAGTGNVYGGGEIGRVEWNTQVKIGVGTGEGTFAPVIYGSVFGAGKGLETHGYSALVRGNSTVTVQGNAKVEHNVYGGGEKSTVGRYWVKGINNNVANAPTAPSDLPDGMPYQQQSGGICRVFIQGNAQIGPDGGASDLAGHVFGAGKGVEPHFVESGTGQSQKMTGTNVLVGFTAANGKTAEELYLEFLQTLALATNSYVTIDGSANVKGSVMGGSENGFVQHDANVTIQGSSCVIGTTTYGNVYGGGRGLATFAEAGKVKGNTTVTVKAGAIKGNVYGGGSLGDVGTIDKTDKKDGQLTYNYKWKQNDGTTANVAEHNTNNTATNTGICTVTISGGTIGISGTVSTDHGNVFGAGKGLATTWWCEKAIAYATNVSVTQGTVYGNIYGGGQIGRVEDDAKVTIGSTNTLTIAGSVFGAGAGLHTHGYSALVRGNAAVTVQGTAQVGGSVYGGGEIASVGRFTVVDGLPKHPDSGGTCTVTILDNAAITGEVFGACKGVDPATIAAADRKSMQLLANAPENHPELWSHYNNDANSPFIWRTYATEADYRDFLETLALTSHPIVTIAGNATVNGSVFGGGERGITLGSVEVNMNGGTVEHDVYGGGSLANSNKGNWETSTNTWAVGKTSASYTTAVNLFGGTINGTVYGGGLGDANTAAIVFGDVKVNLNGLENDDYVEAKHSSLVTAIDEDENGTTDYYRVGDNAGCVVAGYIFGCNNVNGTPKGNVKVHVFKTVKRDANGVIQAKPTKGNNTYELAAVYGGGNQAAYDPADVDTRQTEVIIDGCALTSIEYVYGGGNAAAAPATHVTVNSCYEIGTVFAGGNGAGDGNPGANVGYKNDGTTEYGSGTALAELKGGTIHQAFGGSNSRGNVRTSATAALNEADPDGCPLCIDEIYGGGNEAYQDGTSNIDLGCISYLSNIYGGSKNADINNDIVLTIQSGRFDRVFGGNNLGGNITGTITVNIEETGCHPIIIGQLFGGGNQAAYTAPAGKHGPTVNVKSFTSIGEIYGGGYGNSATVKGDTYVNINVCMGANANGETTTAGFINKWIHFVAGKNSDNTDKIATVWQPEHTPGAIGTIGNVFGGGNEATVDGSTNVQIGLLEYVEITSNIVAGTTDVRGYYTLSGTTYTEVTGNSAVPAVAGTKYYKKVIGANITGNVYGGGNAAVVTGDTNVKIGTNE